jgi:hypothetical protein
VTVSFTGSAITVTPMLIETANRSRFKTWLTSGTEEQKKDAAEYLSNKSIGRQYGLIKKYRGKWN